MELHPDSTWSMPLHELRAIAKVEGKDKLLEKLVLTEAYNSEPAKMAFKLFLQMDDAFQLFIIQSFVEYLAKTEQPSRQNLSHEKQYHS